MSSTVECLPVVQGGIVRNSSKVRTRGLQHFQPVWSVLRVSLPSDPLAIFIFGVLETRTDSKVLSLTLLPLVEHWWPRMVNAVLVRVGEFLAAPFVDTFGCHFAT